MHHPPGRDPGQKLFGFDIFLFLFPLLPVSWEGQTAQRGFLERYPSDPGRRGQGALASSMDSWTGISPRILWLSVFRGRVTTSHDGYTPTSLITTFSPEKRATPDSTSNSIILLRKGRTTAMARCIRFGRAAERTGSARDGILDEGPITRRGARGGAVSGTWPSPWRTTGLSTDQGPRGDLKRERGKSAHDISKDKLGIGISGTQLLGRRDAGPLLAVWATSTRGTPDQPGRAGSPGRAPPGRVGEGHDVVARVLGAGCPGRRQDVAHLTTRSGRPGSGSSRKAAPGRVGAARQRRRGFFAGQEPCWRRTFWDAGFSGAWTGGRRPGGGPRWGFTALLVFVTWSSS